MLSKPSSRRKSKERHIELNLVPMLDCLVTMISFLLYSMTFLALVSIDSPAPTVSKEMNEAKVLEKPLQLTLTIRVENVEIWSPFDRISARKIAHLPDGAFDLQAIHEALVSVKRQFPLDDQLVLMPATLSSYGDLISLMDISRVLDISDEPIIHKNPANGVDEDVRVLFPKIVFGNLLGGRSS